MSNKTILFPARSQDPVSFGHALRAERKVLGKSLMEVAQQTKVRRQTIADLEHGKNVGIHVAFAVLAALGKAVTIGDARLSVEEIQALLEADDD